MDVRTSTRPRLTSDLRLVVPAIETQLTPSLAFALARQLLQRGARKIVLDQADTPARRSKANR